MTSSNVPVPRTAVPRGARLTPRRPASADRPRFPWRTEYEIGDATIDSQHRMLLDLANLLSDALRRGKGDAVVRNALAALRLYAVTHFRDEEAYFAEIGSPFLAEHRREHRALAAELNALSGVAAAADPEALERWVEGRLVSHLKADDQLAARTDGR
ncbi:bacteriohemerythrin [Azospirillum sp. ST 5-10]|uniref:bacteriohemerythrin n=1 Tax=unclassified Azospirillum TaxID=2630922 RepID=UPI003F4A7E99